MLLAAGLGTRLQPLTNHRPKCLMPINEEPLLAIWLKLLAKHHISDVLINTHHQAGQVNHFIEENRDQFDTRVKLVHEFTLLGSAGTVWTNQKFVKSEQDFIIAYADNLTNVDLTRLIAFHQSHTKNDGLLTMGLFRTANPESCGIAALSENGRIKSFVEKPSNPLSNLANAGIYVASIKVFEILAKVRQTSAGRVLDIGFDLLPALAGRMYGYEIKQYLKDIGTLEAYQQAQRQWPPKESYER